MPEIPASELDGPRIVAVLGSVTPPGRLRRALVDGLARMSERTGASTSLIDLAEVRIAFADGRAPEELGDDTAEVLAALDGADAVVLATPIYRGSLTGALKNLLDHTPVAVLEGKPTALIAMGATDHHFLGADRHLRDILTFFGALPLPVASYLTAADFADGQVGERAETELDELLQSTVELTVALREGAWSPAPRPLLTRHRARS